MNGANNRRLHFLLSKSDMMDMKAELVMCFTDDRTSHSSEMTDAEAQKLIGHLEGRLVPGTVDNLANQLRRKVISKFREMGYELDGKADMARLHETIKKHWHKELNAYNVEELRSIIGVLERKWLPWYHKQKEQRA